MVDMVELIALVLAKVFGLRRTDTCGAVYCPGQQRVPCMHKRFVTFLMVHMICTSFTVKPHESSGNAAEMENATHICAD